MKDNQEEMFPVVDEDGNITGAATRGECHSGSKLLHPVVHLHVFGYSPWGHSQTRLSDFILQCLNGC